MIIGMWIEIENYQMCSQVQPDFQCWIENHQMDFHGLGETHKKTNDLQTMWTAHPQKQLVQICTAWSHVITRTRVAQELQGSGSHIFVSQNNSHPRVMSRSMPHLTLTTSTSSLPFTSSIFPTTSPTHTRPSVHDEYFPCDGPRQGGRSTQIPSLTSYEPKLIEPEDLEPRRIELDRNLGTDPCQIQERFMRDNYQTYRWRYGGIWKSWFRYVQSQMHSDHDSAESIADSDLEDGELQKVLASPLYVQGRENCNSSRIPTAPGKLSAIIREREVSAKRTQADRRESLMSSSSQEPRASGKSAAMSSSGSAEPRNQFKSSIFKNADPSIVGRSLLEGIKDHLLSQARSDLAKQELQVEPLNNWSASFSNKLMLKDWNYRTHNMDMLNLDENKCVNKKNNLWKRKFSEILDSEICTKWVKLRLRKFE